MLTDHSDLIALGTRGIDVVSETVSIDPHSAAFRYGSHVVVLYRRQRVSDVHEIDCAKPFHLTRCEALDRVLSNTEPSRHTLTSRRDGLFVMVHEAAAGPIDHAVALPPCKLCLAELNYRGYRNAKKAEKQVIVNSFNVGEFTDDIGLPHGHAISPLPIAPQSVNQYPDNWDAVSRVVREKAMWVCGSCGVSCNTHRALLHTHHVNGDKTDLRDANLVPLCASCHQSVPGHQMMYVSLEQVAMLSALREAQGLTPRTSQ